MVREAAGTASALADPLIALRIACAYSDAMAGTTALLSEPDPRAAARVVERRFGTELDRLERGVLRAAAGDPAGADLYLEAWTALAGALVGHATAPPAALRHARVRRARAPLIPRERLLAAALAAPVSAWAERAGLRVGLALALVNLLRETLPAGRPLGLPSDTQPAWASDEARRRAMALILDAIRRMVESDTMSRPAPETATSRADATALRRVGEVLRLDHQGLAEAFRVRRQAVDQWFQRGVPADRQAKLSSLLALAELLARKLRAGTVPGVARTAAPAYGDRTMLQMIAADEHDALLADVRASFDWSSSA
jgi:hypothetical protein